MKKPRKKKVKINKVSKIKPGDLSYLGMPLSETPEQQACEKETKKNKIKSFQSLSDGQLNIFFYEKIDDIDKKYINDLPFFERLKWKFKSLINR